MTWAVITTRNEESSIGPLISKIHHVGVPNVVVVDEQSTDDTCLRASEAGAHVLMPVEWLGIGRALMRGWKYALDHGAERIVQLDAGGSHDPAEIIRFEHKMTETKADIVIGERFSERASYRGKGYRPFGSRVIARTCSVLYGHNLRDWTSGFRMFRADAARMLRGNWYRARMHGWQVEVLKTAFRCRMRVEEVPISYTLGRSAANLGVMAEMVGAICLPW